MKSHANKDNDEHVASSDTTGHEAPDTCKERRFHAKKGRINIVDAIRKEAGPYLSQYAVSQEDKSISYGTLLDAVDTCRTVLIDKGGVGPCCRVALLCEDSIQYIISALGVLDAGAIMIPASPSLSIKEFDGLCDRMAASHVISAQPLFSRQPDLPTDTDYEKVVSLGENLSLYRIKSMRSGCTDSIGNRKPPLQFPSDVSDPAFIRFTSGTTGVNKGVLLTHQAIIERTDAADERLKITHKETVAWFLSMSYHFVVTILLFLRRGAHIVLAGHGFPKGAIEMMTRFPPTFIYASPFHYAFMTSSLDFSSTLLQGIRMAVSTAMALEKRTAEAFSEKFGIALSQAYGIIEVGLPFINDRMDGEFMTAVGRLLPAYQLKLTDQDEAGQGSILLKGKGMFEGYVSPWLRRETWFDTGDIGRMKEGYLFICGRRKNVINFSGMKIFPEEVEEIIRAFEGIDEVRVFGEPHPLYGALPVAEYTLSDPDAVIRLPELKRFLMKRLDLYKIPKSFVQKEKITKTLSGKVKR